MKKITGIIVTALALFALGACGSSGGSSSSSSDKSENQLAAIKKSGVLKVATSADYAPLNSIQWWMEKIKSLVLISI